MSVNDFSEILEHLAANSVEEREVAYRDLRDYLNLTSSDENMFWSSYIERLLKALTLDIRNANSKDYFAQYALENLARLLSGVVFNTISNEDLEKYFCISNAVVTVAIESVIEAISKKERVLSSFALFLISEQRVPKLIEKHVSELTIAISSCACCITLPEVQIYSLKALYRIYEQIPSKLLQYSSLWAFHMVNCLIAEDIRVQNVAVQLLKRISENKSYPISSTAAEAMNTVMDTLM